MASPPLYKRGLQTVKRTIIVCIDGCGVEYLHEGGSAFIRQIGKNGCFLEVDSMIPSVTNVNATSILTGEYPEEHGITTNYYFERETGREVFMESPDFIRTRTILERGADEGLKTGLIASKEKLKSLLERGAATSFSAENPPPWLKRLLGPPPSIYSVEVDVWLMKALRETVLGEDLDLVYTQTTDYAMHKHAPEEEESKRHIRGIGQELQETMEVLEDRGDEVLLCITADHGMSEKTRSVNLELALKRRGITSRLNTIIADRYTVHHRNLGGAAYVYLKKAEDRNKSLKALKEIEGVELALPLEQASELYHLDKTRIGDILVLGGENYVFGLTDKESDEASLRSHGSLHERRVPLIVNTPQAELEGDLLENKDLASLVMNRITVNRG